MADRQNFSLDPEQMGILSTEEIIDAGENFLNSDVDDITLIKTPKEKVKSKKDNKPDEDEEEEEVKKKSPIKEKREPPKEVKDDDLLSSLEDHKGEEEEEETEENTKKEDGQTELNEEQPEENVFSTLSKELLKSGVFTYDEDDNGNEIAPDAKTPEEFLARFQLEGRKQAADTIERFLGRFGENYREMFEHVYVRGVDPMEYLSRYSKIDSVSGLNIEDEANQERIMREFYRQEGRAADYIDRKIQQHRNYNDLAEEAKEAQKLLISKEQEAIDDAATKKQEEVDRKTRIRNEYINNVGKILTEKLKTKDFDGIPVEKKFADQTYSYLTKERYQTPNSQLLTEFDRDILELDRPENHELKIKVAMLMQMLKEDPKLTPLAKRAVSTENNELFKGLKSTVGKDKTKKDSEKKTDKTPSSWFQQQ